MPHIFNFNVEGSSPSNGMKLALRVYCSSLRPWNGKRRYELVGYGVNPGAPHSGLYLLLPVQVTGGHIQGVHAYRAGSRGSRWNAASADNDPGTSRLVMTGRRGEMSKHILITGGAGFIGSHLADELLEHGARVRALDLLATPVITGRYRVGDVRHCFADITLAHKVLGYEPQVTLDDGLQQFAAWVGSQMSVDSYAEASAELEARGLTR
jgi:NAD dependent epimerase/dehydratase family